MRCYLLLLSLIFTVKVYALNYSLIPYTVGEKDTFTSIVSKFLRKNLKIEVNTPFVQKTLEKNPHVTDWNNLKPGTLIIFFISDDFLDISKFTDYMSKLPNDSDFSKYKRLSLDPIGWKGSLFYMSSMGTFHQKAPNISDIYFQQNSPFSLGGAFSYYPEEKRYSLSFSGYYSYLLETASTQSISSVPTPPEFGGNLYGEYNWRKQQLTPYGGLDFERFSLLDPQGLRNDRRIYIDDVKMLFLTVGVAKSYTLFKRKFFTKMSYSKTLYTAFTRNIPTYASNEYDYVESGKYQGSKVMLYVNTKLTESFFVHMLVKFHILSGSSDLTIFRVGLGLGYLLF